LECREWENENPDIDEDMERGSCWRAVLVEARGGRERNEL
jgi:hypothetical protein